MAATNEMEGVAETVQAHIQLNRNELYFADKKRNESMKGRFEMNVFKTHFLEPLLNHGTHLIYAPDDYIRQVIETLGNGCPSCKKNKGFFHGLKDAYKHGPTYVFAAFVLASGFLYMYKGQATKCWVQETFLGWAMWNADPKTGFALRFLSICGMMCARLLISNVLPFTSPAFAFLIAQSMTAGHEWAGTFFLVFCSMPAGAILPALDYIGYSIQCIRTPKYENLKEPTLHQTSLDQYKQYFPATRLFSRMTDFLPFSFWVRRFFMEPTFLSLTEAGGSHAEASAGAVLAGHFMIWSGPATTMYQRTFVPDWWTCIFIQPIGLFEDIAVVLGTWAGNSPEDQKWAELSLYFFMLLCNVLRYYSGKARFERENADQLGKGTLPGRTKRALIVGGLTIAIFIARLCRQDPFFPITWPDNAMTTTTTTTISGQQCPTTHSNIKVMGMTVGWVSFLAVMFRLVARFFAPLDYRAKGALSEALLP